MTAPGRHCAMLHNSRISPMMPPALAEPDFWKSQGYPTFARFWEVCNHLFDALNKFTLNAGKSKDKNEIIIRSLCISTGISFADVGMLVGHGHGLGAMKISRSCLESAINAEYLRLEPTEHRDRKSTRLNSSHT